MAYKEFLTFSKAVATSLPDETLYAANCSQYVADSLANCCAVIDPLSYWVCSYFNFDVISLTAFVASVFIPKKPAICS